jgi:hypothetical protein
MWSEEAFVFGIIYNDIYHTYIEPIIILRLYNLGVRQAKQKHLDRVNIPIGWGVTNILIEV